jgi:hypothetical protein
MPRTGKKNDTKIGTRRYNECPALSSITFTTSLTAIGSFAFGSNDTAPCNTDTNTLIVPASLPMSVYSSVQFQCTVTLIGPPTAAPSAVPTAMPTTFTTDCVDRTSQGRACCSGAIEIDTAISLIGVNAFIACAITSVKMGSNIVSIGLAPFVACTMLSSVELPTSVTSIFTGAFSQTGLLSVSLPISVVILDQGAFLACPALRIITLTTGLTAIGPSAFGDNDVAPCNTNLNTLVVPASLDVSVYSSVQFQCTVAFDSPTVAPSAVPTVEPSAVPSGTVAPSAVPPTTGCVNKFSQSGDCCSGAIEIDTAISLIGVDAFIGCAITSVKMGSNIVSIGEKSFQVCTMLSSVDLPTSVTRILDDAFAFTLLRYVVLSTSVVSLGRRAYDGSPSTASLSSITLTTALTAIGANAFGDFLFPPCNTNSTTLIVPISLHVSVYSSVQFLCTVTNIRD